ncbi:methyltransferase, putative [Plasmodium ovale wallikeri]|uniref:Methyltransferase, putative n=2 Tax=Plasmodium ovale TaxID=36330 RepID=A0A1A8ZZY4_PLAOA|nr:methyltransferase, putative [Plasmodium ovale wallikeri]SBT50086.1 methyltransferase, putative [Plasmodium ovale wallikeri]SBT82685.1 mRNA methyltransferase, putative [Plasmodium ovale]
MKPPGSEDSEDGARNPPNFNANRGNTQGKASFIPNFPNNLPYQYTNNSLAKSSNYTNASGGMSGSMEGQSSHPYDDSSKDIIHAGVGKENGNPPPPSLPPHPSRSPPSPDFSKGNHHIGATVMNSMYANAGSNKYDAKGYPSSMYPPTMSGFPPTMNGFPSTKNPNNNEFNLQQNNPMNMYTPLHPMERDNMIYNMSNVTNEYDMSSVASKYDMSNVTNEYDMSGVASKYDMSNVTNEYDMSNVTSKYDMSNVTSKYNMSNVTSKYDMSNVTSKYDDVTNDGRKGENGVQENSNGTPYAWVNNPPYLGGNAYQNEEITNIPNMGIPCNGSNSRSSSNTRQREGKSGKCNINVDGRERLQNDYNQNFVNTGERPQNFIRDSDENKRFDKYPKLKQLLELKNIIIKKRSTPARYIRCDLRTFDLGNLDVKFDVILIDPPWKEYYDRKIYNLDVLNSIHIDNYDLYNDINNEKDKYWSLEDIARLDIEKIAEVPSFLFLWCGVTHLEDARILLNKWGYRRCEDICWLKTNIYEKNKKIKYLNEINNENSYLQRTTEHCLVGIKGAVRRSYDIHLIHANLDTDVIIAEETDEHIYNNNKPEELYKIIEKFCLGRRKIELFGTNRNIRNGWLTLGKNIDTTLFNKEEYITWFEGDIAWPEATSYVGGKYMGTTAEIENLRPKSPPRNANS